MNNIVTRFNKFFICLFLITAQEQSHSQSSVRPINGPRSERHETDELGRRQGSWKYYYSNGDVREDINYINNLQEGLDTKYFQGKKIQVESNYLGGRKDGDYKRYFLSGQVAMEGKYVLGQRDGVWTENYEDGQVKAVREYKKGVKDGSWKSYDRKGTLLSDIAYKNGVDVNAPPPVAKVQPVANKKAPATNKNYTIKGGAQDTAKIK